MRPGPWKEWCATGVEAPENHPPALSRAFGARQLRLKLLLSNPQLAKYIWNPCTQGFWLNSCRTSTTCGGQMSGMALQVSRDRLSM